MYKSRQIESIFPVILKEVIEVKKEERTYMIDFYRCVRYNVRVSENYQRGKTC